VSEWLGFLFEFSFFGDSAFFFSLGRFAFDLIVFKGAVFLLYLDSLRFGGRFTAPSSRYLASLCWNGRATTGRGPLRIAMQ
jgi:hypothetical protein